MKVLTVIVCVFGETFLQRCCDSLSFNGQLDEELEVLVGKPDDINSQIVEYSSSPRVATGVGLTWQSPMGNISVDFAVPVVKEDYDKTEVFRLNFGTNL